MKENITGSLLKENRNPVFLPSKKLCSLLICKMKFWGCKGFIFSTLMKIHRIIGPFPTSTMLDLDFST